LKFDVVAETSGWIGVNGRNIHREMQTKQKKGRDGVRTGIMR
jgi:hypothetical protein